MKKVFDAESLTGKNKVKFICFCVLNAILLIVVICLLVSAIKGAKNKKIVPGTAQAIASEDTEGKLFSGFMDVKEETTISTEIIEDGLEELGLLITEEYYFTQVEEYENTKSWAIFSSTSSFIYSYDGTVTAGIDCTKITVDKDDEKKEITITIPTAEIQTVEIDFDTFKVYEEKTGIWNKMGISNYNSSLVEFKKSAKEKALEKGIIEKANEGAVAMIKNFVNSVLDNDEYTVNYIQK